MDIDIEKYKRELEDGLNPKQLTMPQNYSREYQQFLTEQTSYSSTFYTHACNVSAKMIHAPASKKDHDKLMDEFQKQKDDEHIAKSKLDNK